MDSIVELASQERQPFTHAEEAEAFTAGRRHG